MVRKLKTFIVFIILFSSLCVFADKERETIGDLLNKIGEQGKTFQKRRSLLPQIKKLRKHKPLRKVDLGEVKPPSSVFLYYDEDFDGVELERVTDQLIADAYELTKRFKKSSRRGELWLRLAQLYLEKSRLIELRLQDKYDRQLEAYHSGKIKRLPKLNLRAANEYNKKAIQLYLWFLRDYPKDRKLPQVLFLLGHNYFELGDTKRGMEYYLRLTREHPKSVFVDESHFSLGEFYFEKEKWESAATHYKRILKNKRSRIYSFAMYKLAWCQYKTNKMQAALRSLEKVIYAGRVDKNREQSRTRVNRIRLASEAIRDLVLFYAEVGSPARAGEYFSRVVGERSKVSLMEKLAYFYWESGDYKKARSLFQSLITINPLAPKSYEYQYKIVQSYSSTNRSVVFKRELLKWIENYGEDSGWFHKNSHNKELVSRSNQLIESTLRNYVLQTHQSAQKSKNNVYSRKQVQFGYETYFNSFKKSDRLDEMNFFYAEFLYEIGELRKSAYHYSWVVEKRPDSKYYGSSMLNVALSLEKLLPTPKEIKAIVGNRTEPVEFDKRVKDFEAATIRYVKSPPSIVQKEYSMTLQYRIGSLYYYYNQFDLALQSFHTITQKFPQTKYAEYSANLILDIYNLKKDYKGLVKAADKLLAVPNLSSSKLSSQIRDIKQKSVFKQAEEHEKTGNYKKAGEAYEEFIKSNSESSLAIGARFNAAVNFEKAGLVNRAVSSYRMVLLMKGRKQNDLQNKSIKSLAIIYERLGRYKEASKYYEVYAQRNPKDSVSVDFLYNVAIIQDGMKNYGAALKNYQKYYDRSQDKKKKEVFFLMGKIWEKRGNLSKALQYYERCIKGGLKNKSLHIEITYTIAKLNKQLNRKTQANQWYKKTIAFHNGLGSQKKKMGLRFAAEARFQLAYNTYTSLLAISIPSGKSQQAIVQKKLKMVNQLKEELASVIKYDDGDQIVAALTVQGQALQHMASSIHSAPVPKGLKGDDLKVYKTEINNIVRPFKEQAVASYQSAIKKAFTFQAYNSWLKLAMVELQKINPEEKMGTVEYMVHLTHITDRMGL